MSPSPTTPAGTAPSLYTEKAQDGYSNASAAATAAAALSQPHIPTSNGTSNRRKKPPAVAGSRGVANLTPEQLAKKRANDREAQRAIRERTKNTIEGLLQRIKELESQQPYQELQRICRERDRALEECEQLRNKLAMVQNVIASPQQPSPQQQQQPNLHELAALTAQQSPLPPLNAASSPHAHSGAGERAFGSQVHPLLRSPPSVLRPLEQGSAVSIATPPYSIDQEPARKWTPRQDASPHSPHSSVAGAGHDSRLPPPTAILDRGHGERLGLNYVLEPKHPSVSASPPLHTSQHYLPSPILERPMYERISSWSRPESPLDIVLVEFVEARRKMIAEGRPKVEVIGPEYPNFDSFTDSHTTGKVIDHPVSALLTEIIFKFPGIHGLPTQAAVHYMMYLFLRWSICPCEDCYNRLPPFYRPIREQLEIPHPAWTDTSVWPHVRRALITEVVPLEDFFIPFTSKLRVNWPPEEPVLLPQERSETSPAYRINPAFEAHLRDLNNWSVGMCFKTAFPQMCTESMRIEG